MKYLLPLLLILNVGPAKEQPKPAETHIHYNYTVEEMKHIDDDESDNNEAVEIINNILYK